MMKCSIAIIEDDADLREVLEINLNAWGFKAFTYTDGESGLKGIRSNKPDLVLLDLILPDRDGRDICRSLRADRLTSNIPIIMVTVRSNESDIILGLGSGADDYVAKPFHLGELLARIQAALRRSLKGSWNDEGETLSFGPLSLDRRRFCLLVDGVDARLTATEFRLLQHLMENPGNVFNRQLLIDFAIGEDIVVNERTVDTHLGMVRRKIGPYRSCIRTVWGIGYRFDPPGEPEGSA